MNEPDSPQILTLNEAASLLGLNAPHDGGASSRLGDLKVFRLGGAIRLYRSELETRPGRHV